jgi:hypothetical protein
VDGTVIYSKDVRRGDNCWYIGHYKFCPPDRAPVYLTDDATGIHDDAIEVIFHLLSGDKKREDNERRKEESRNSPSPSA